MAQQVRKGEELPESPLKIFLQENDLIKDVNSDMKITQFSTGFSNLTYLLQVENKELVLRRPPAGAIKRGHDMSREFKVLSGLNKTTFPAPKAWVYTNEKSVIGSSFYVMEKIDGIILSAKEAAKRKIPATDFLTIADRWLDTFIDLHQIDYETIGLQDLGRPKGYVERQVSNWGKQYLKAATEEIPDALFVMKWLAEQQPKEYQHSLIHNDYKYDNVVFEDDSWNRINAVLDWEMCTLGDPLMDLGTSIAYWTMATDNPMIVQGWPSPTSMEGNPGREELVQSYAQKSGRPINNLVFYYSFGLFKIAVIVQQIFYRYHHGMTSDPRFANLNHATRLFCQMAKQAIEKNRIENLL